MPPSSVLPLRRCRPGTGGIGCLVPGKSTVRSTGQLGPSSARPVTFIRGGASMSFPAWSVGVAVSSALLAALVGGEGLVSGPLRAAQAKGKMTFELYQDTAKEYRWRLKGTDGETLGTGGQGYKAKDDCKKGVARIQEEMGKGTKTKYSFEVYEDKAKEYRWRLKAPNGQVVASSSGGYKSKAD